MTIPDQAEFIYDFLFFFLEEETIWHNRLTQEKIPQLWSAGD